MATTKSNRIGKTRIKLCELLNESFPDWHFEPKDISSQLPIYASTQFDCCSWYANGILKNSTLSVSVHSWNTMTRCVKNGIEFSKDNLSAEIFAK